MALRLRSGVRGARKRSGSTSPAARKDDDLSEGLPPVDGAVGDDDSERAFGAAADELEGTPDAEERDHDLLDDGTLGDAAVMEESDAREPERGWLDDADEAAGLDVGDHEVELGGESTPSLDDSTEPDDDDDDPALDPGELGADTGEEGIEGEGDELREEDLPALDADDDGEVDERSLYEAPESVFDVDPALAWDDRAWSFEPVDATPAYGLAGGDEAVFACAGGTLVRLAPAPLARFTLPEPAHRGVVDAHGDAWLVAESGALLRARRDGEEIVAIAGFTGHAVDVASAGGAIWVLGADGVVAVTHDAGVSFRPVADDVIALAGSGERAVVLVADSSGVREIVFQAAGARTTALPFAGGPASIAAVDRDTAWELVVRGDVSVVFAHGVGVFRRSGGAPWSRVPASADAFAVTILGRGGSDDDALLLALSDMEEPTRLAYVPASAPGATAGPSEPPRLVAELGPGEDVRSGADDDGHGEGDGDGEGDEEICLALAVNETGDGDLGTVLVAGPFGTRRLGLAPARH